MSVPSNFPPGRKDGAVGLLREPRVHWTSQSGALRQEGRAVARLHLRVDRAATL
jgi:hypothetical protein